MGQLKVLMMPYRSRERGMKMDTSEALKGRTLEEVGGQGAPGQEEILALASLKLKNIRERGSEDGPGV